MSSQRLLTIGMLREVLAEVDSALDNSEVWVDIDHGVIRVPVSRYWHSTARVTGAFAGPGLLVLQVMTEESGEVAA